MSRMVKKLIKKLIKKLVAKDEEIARLRAEIMQSRGINDAKEGNQPCSDDEHYLGGYGFEYQRAEISSAIQEAF